MVALGWSAKLDFMIDKFQRLLSNKTILNIGNLFVGSSAARVLSAVVIFIIARQSGVEKFGLYTAAFSLAKLTAVTFSLGLDNWLLREISQSRKQVDTLAGAALAIKIVLGFVWLLALGAITPFLNQDAFPLDLVMLSAFAVWFEEILNAVLAVFKGLLRNDVTSKLMVTSQLILLGITAVIAQLPENSPALFFVGRILAMVLGLCISLWVLLRSEKLKLQLESVFRALRGTISFGLSNGLSVIYERVDITIIAHFLGKIATGIYSPAISLMTTLFLIPSVIYGVMLPVFSKMHGDSRKELPKYSFRLFWLSAILGVFMGVGLVVIAYPLVWFIYTPAFISSAPILVILSSVLLFKCLSFASAAVLAAVGWQKKRVYVQFVSAILNIGLNLLVVNQFGIRGVAYVYILTEFVLTIGYMALVLKWQKEHNLLSKLRTVAT
jgi:O-antigen/teichoic acid export membrane protein